MRWDCGETWDEKKARLSSWNPFYAWYPIKVSDHDCRWFECVQRKGEYWVDWGDSGWNWEYKDL